MRLKTVKTVIREEAYGYAVRQAQESVELALKACLRAIGIEYPKHHDVGPILKKERKRFPGWFEKEIDSIARLSKSLAKKREPAMYGSEPPGSPPGMLFSKRDAKKAMIDAIFAFNHAKRLINELQYQDKKQERD